MNKALNVDSKNYENSKQLDLDKCNVIKVFMMLAVILTHCISLWSKSGWFVYTPEKHSEILAFLCDWFGTFHIYVFIFVSGYLFCYLKYEKKRYVSFSKDALDRAKRLLLPYLITSALWVVPFYLFYYDVNFIDIIRKFVFAIAPHQLWFLVMLFVLFCLFYCISDWLYRKHWLMGIFVSLIFYGVGTLAMMFLPNIFQIWKAFTCVIFYYMGFAFRKHPNNILYKIPWFIYFLIHIFVFHINFYFVSNQSGIIFKALSVALSFLCNVLGTLTIIIGLSKFSFKKLRKTRIYSFLLKHNFVMYLFHQQLIYVAISLLNNKASTSVIIAVNLIFSSVISALIAVALSKIPKVKYVFGYK